MPSSKPAGKVLGFVCLPYFIPA